MKKPIFYSCILASALMLGGTQFSAIAQLSNVAATQQSHVLKGRVTDQSGEPLIGATIKVKGNVKAGVATDFDGNFTLTGVKSGTLVVSYVGYNTREIAFTAGQNLNVRLIENTADLDELVVVGYATQKKENLTGAVAAVNFKDVSNIPVANTSTMLQGRLPGVVLQTNGAQAGHDDPEIRVRGVGTLGSGAKNNPMVLIDGIESSIAQMSSLAPGDIESVSVLKDAASAAIYGVRAANGVILVTTKRGSEMKPTITYSGSVALQQATVLPDFVSSYDWALMYNECQPGKAYTADMLQKLKDGSDPDHFANTNWAKEMFRTAMMHQHHLSLAGGSKDMHYMVSMQYLNQEGILKNTSNERFNFRSNLDGRVGILKVGLNLAGNKQGVHEPVQSVTGEGLMRMLTWFTRPTVPVQYSNGKYGVVDGNPAIGASVFKNPVEQMYYGRKTNDHYRFDGKAFAELDLYKGLTFRTSLSYKYYGNDMSTFSPRTDAKYSAEGDVLLPAGTNNTLVDYTYKETSYINENILTYNNTFGDHSLSILLGHSIQQNRWDTNTASRQGFPTDNIYELDGGTLNDNVSGSAEQTRLQSFFGRVNYNYANRYLLEMNVRRDGSSRLPSSNRYATFPSFSAAWNIANEAFMSDVQWLSALKLRASWGKLGNQEIGNYAYAETLSAQGSYYIGDKKYIGMKTSKIANENIKWETTTMSDIGIDASVLNGRVNFTFDWYNKETSDILLQLPMPGIFLGSLAAPYQNAGKVRNRGWELSASYQDGRGDWQWQAGFSLAGVKNEIIDMAGRESISGQTINREGEAIGSYYALRAIGIYRTDADLQRTNSQGVVIKQNGQTPVLGDIMYEDFNDDGNINDADRQIIGNPFPKLQYSFTLGASYKNFDISTFWQGVAGIDRFNWDETTISNGGNKTTRWLDRYSASNPNGSMPRMGGEFNNTYSSFWLTKGDYLRLKNLEIGYTFNNCPLLTKAGIQNARVYVAGSNLLTFTSLDDYDPEKTSSDTRNDVHPNVRAYSFGLNVQF